MGCTSNTPTTVIVSKQIETFIEFHLVALAICIAALRISATTIGLIPLNTSETSFSFLNGVKKAAIARMHSNEGRVTPMVLKTAPKIPPILYPKYIDVLTATAPGRD